MSRTSPVSETPDILERLQEESMRLCGRSISRGDLDSGLASNLADAAIYEIERLRGLADQLNFVVSSGLAPRPAVTDEMVERAWAGIVGRDVAATCHQASIIRADLKAGLEAALSHSSTDRQSGPTPGFRLIEEPCEHHHCEFPSCGCEVPISSPERGAK